MATVPGTLTPVALTASVNVNSVPAGEELIVVGSIAWLNVAVTAVPVTRLALLLLLVATVAAPLLGMAEVTVGSLAVPPGAPAAPGTTVTPTATVPLAPAPAPAPAPVPPPPPPHPASATVSNNAMGHVNGLDIFWYLFI
jgi:hypothetical protein